MKNTHHNDKQQNECLILTLDSEWRIIEGADALQELMGLDSQKNLETIDDVIKEPSLGLLKTKLARGIPVCALSLTIENANQKCPSEFLLGAIPKQGPNGRFRGATLVLKEVDPGNIPPELILENVADGVFSIDGDGRITSFNTSAERITGWTKEKVLGQYCHDIFKTDI